MSNNDNDNVYKKMWYALKYQLKTLNLYEDKIRIMESLERIYLKIDDGKNMEDRPAPRRRGRKKKSF